MTSIFGGNAQNSNQSNTGGGGLFGSTPNNTQQGGNAGGGLFGSTPNAQQSGNTGGGLFGSNANTQQNGNTGGGLFGSNNQSTQSGNTGGGLFGSSTNQSGNVGGGLFGSSIQPSGNTGGGLFGSTANQNAQGNTGQNNNTQQTNQQQNIPSLFGTQPQQQPQTTAFGGAAASQNQQQQQPVQTSSIFNPSAVSVGNFGHTLSAGQLQRLQYSGLSAIPNEKSVKDQLLTVASKWNPDNPPGTPVTTTLKTYLYNAVPKEYAPFFYPNTDLGEDERSWEEALSQKPDPPKVDGKEVSNVAYVPILCKGFKALGDRVETQAKSVQEMRSRLHEMNNSLSAVMNKHQQVITVKIAAAKRQHQVLSQRCLRLAVKVQILRNRGYALDTHEEHLRKTLMSLEKQVLDPAFLGREDEIWARMSVLRDRARWLEEEGKRLPGQLDEQSRQGGGANSSFASGVPDDVLVKTRKILKDYDGQLQHLNKELEDVKKEYAAWEEGQRRR